jgi:hypothetical protein
VHGVVGVRTRAGGDTGVVDSCTRVVGAEP